MLDFIIIALIFTDIILLIWGLVSLKEQQTEDFGEFYVKLSLVLCIITIIVAIIFY